MELLTKEPTSAAPAELFTRTVYFDVMARGEADSRLRVNTVRFSPGERHWHGALPEHFMTHLAIWEDDHATWGEYVTDDEYDQATQA